MRQATLVENLYKCLFVADVVEIYKNGSVSRVLSLSTPTRDAYGISILYSKSITCGHCLVWSTFRFAAMANDVQIFFLGNKFRDVENRKKRNERNWRKVKWFSSIILLNDSFARNKRLWWNCACRNALLNSKLIFASEYEKFLWHCSPNQKLRINVAAVALKLAGKAKTLIKFNFDVINLVIFLLLFARHSMTSYANQIAWHSSKSQTRQSSEDRIVVFRTKNSKVIEITLFPIWSVRIEIVAMTASSVPSVQIPWTQTSQRLRCSSVARMVVVDVRGESEDGTI